MGSEDPGILEVAPIS
jgi:hypothetical protein